MLSCPTYQVALGLGRKFQLAECASSWWSFNAFRKLYCTRGGGMEGSEKKQPTNKPKKPTTPRQIPTLRTTKPTHDQKKLCLVASGTLLWALCMAGQRVGCLVWPDMALAVLWWKLTGSYSKFVDWTLTNKAHRRDPHLGEKQSYSDLHHTSLTLTC